jgi:hypothetical protein
LAEQDGQNKTARTGRAKQEIQKGTGRKVQSDRLARTGLVEQLPGQYYPDRAAKRRLPVQDC